MFDDGAKVYIQFPSGLAQSEAPPLFVIGPDGKPALVNYRVRGTTYIVDRLFAAAELQARDGAAAGGAHRAHRCRMAGDEAMTTPEQEGRPKPDAKVAPETLELRARPQPVTRINRKVLIGGAAVLLFLISCIVLVALKPPSLRVAGPQELFNVDHKPITDALSKLPATYDGVKPDKKADAGKQPPAPIVPPGVPQLTAPAAIRSPRPSGPRRRASPAWPARPARARCSSGCS